MFVLLLLLLLFLTSLFAVAPLISSASSNQSVYAGDTVIVTASINRSRFGKKLWCNIALYNGCEFDDCEYESGNISNTFSATFQVKNVLNQTKVQFVVIDNGILCFNDSFINIKGMFVLNICYNVYVHVLKHLQYQ